MLSNSAIAMGGQQGPVEKAQLTKPELLTEAEATEHLDRIAPDWSLHLYDSAVIDHILKVINNPRMSRAGVTRRYRALRPAAGRSARLHKSGRR